MTRSTIALLVLAVLATIGCSSARHRFTPYRSLGNDVPIEVQVRAKAGAAVRGTVYHRTDGAGRFEPTPLQRRGNQLWVMLPTDGLGSQATVEYYIDVETDGELTTLGSPAAPYVVTLLDDHDMTLMHLSTRVVASHADDEVRMILRCNGADVGRPTIVYQMPGMPGQSRARMDRTVNGDYEVVIPAANVSAGRWRFAVEVPVGGDPHRLPADGFNTFEVDDAPAQVAAQPSS